MFISFDLSREFPIFIHHTANQIHNRMQDLLPFLPPDSGIYDGLHSVVIWFDYGLEDDTLFYDLSLDLAQLLEDSEIGKYDGHEMEINNRDGSYYMYGPNAETLFKTVLPTLEKYDFMKGASAVLRFGDLDGEAAEIVIEI